MARPNKLKIVSIAVGIACVVGAGDRIVSSMVENNSSKVDRRLAGALRKQDIAEIIGKRLVAGTAYVPNENVKAGENELNIQYSIDQQLQATIEQTIKKGKVPYGAFVAMDAKTGQILAMVSHGMRGENMALRSTFPAASVFKVITAAAAIENGKLQHNSLIPVRGSYHTLYKQNVMAGGGIEPTQQTGRRRRWARLITFEEALAKSVNSVFGKVGIFGVGHAGLRNIATRFFFNKPIPFEMPVSMSQSTMPLDDSFGLAEIASGYTRNNTMSPLHGALIAAAVANEGVVMEPSVVTKLTDTKDGKVVYNFEPKELGTVIDKATSQQLAIMMHKTIVDGTSRRAFRGLQRSIALSDVYIGGKTGTLNGWDPVGRYDWFVGFGEHQNKSIAVAALCIHGDRHGIKASQVARTAFETYFQRVVAQERAPIAPKPNKGLGEQASIQKVAAHL